MAIVDCPSEWAHEGQFWILSAVKNCLARRFVVGEEMAGTQKRREVCRGLRWWQRVCWRRGIGPGRRVGRGMDPLQALMGPAKRSVVLWIVVVPAILQVSPWPCCGMRYHCNYPFSRWIGRLAIQIVKGHKTSDAHLIVSLSLGFLSMLPSPDLKFANHCEAKVRRPKRMPELSWIEQYCGKDWEAKGSMAREQR